MFTALRPYLLTEHKVKLLCVQERVMIDSSGFSPFFT